MKPRKAEVADTQAQDLQPWRAKAPQRHAVSRRGMVAAAHPGATEAGVEMLERGGNAMDAAVAAAFALGVCEPAASGLGGQTMMLLYHAETRKTIALDGSSHAPSRATPEKLTKSDRLRGYCSCTVPSTPAALGYALTRYGTLDLQTVLEPATRLAEQGCEVTELQHFLAKRELEALQAGTAAPLFLRDAKRPFRVGQRFVQPALAWTLRRLAKHGVEGFYQGRIARLIHEDMMRNGGLIRRDDLALIPWPIERKPVSCKFEDLRVRTMPPPGAGRTLVEMLNILGHFEPRQRDPDTPTGAVLLAHVIRQAFRDRRDRPFDPNFYAQVPDKKMLSAEHAESRAEQIRQAIEGRGETTHLSVMDRHGNAVALTQSIERVYGSCCASPELGFLYNDYMSAFEYEGIRHPHYLRPNSVPWASVAPTIIFRSGKPWLAIGSPGSERITPTIVQVLLRLGSHTPFAAVDAPRLHCSPADQVSLEAARMRSDVPQALEEQGFQLDVREPYSFYLGCVQLVLREGRDFVGVADPRRDGCAGGPRNVKRDA